MKFIKIFDKYEINKEGVVRNISTTKELKVSEKNGKLMCWLMIEGKSKNVNISALLEDLANEFIEVVEEVVTTKKKGRKGKGYKVTMVDDTILTFEANKEAMEYFKEKCPDVTYREDYFWYFVRNKMIKPMNALGIKKVENI